jgi:aldehyde:ferredoxin oxidoreductase
MVRGLGLGVGSRRQSKSSNSESRNVFMFLTLKVIELRKLIEPFDPGNVIIFSTGIVW